MQKRSTAAGVANYKNRLVNSNLSVVWEKQTVDPEGDCSEQTKKRFTDKPAEKNSTETEHLPAGNKGTKIEM